MIASPLNHLAQRYISIPQYPIGRHSGNVSPGAKRLSLSADRWAITPGQSLGQGSGVGGE